MATPDPVLTSSAIRALTGYSPDTLKIERNTGRLPGERRPGVKGYVYPVRHVRAWLKYKGMNELIAKLP